MNQRYAFFALVLMMCVSQTVVAETWVFVKTKSIAGDPPGQPKSLKAELVPGFDPKTSIEIDANILGYTFISAKVSDQVERAPNVRKDEFDWGTMYSWNTLSKTASTYSYLCRRVTKSCLKVGPYQPIDFDWSTPEFRGTK
ncbi:hypothetical protein BH10BDE1_BH10BDE1_13590 [soil metagenome]